MRINSIKFTVVMNQLFMITAIIGGLFFIEIPAGNREVTYLILGAMSTNLVTAINNLFQKPRE